MELELDHVHFYMRNEMILGLTTSVLDYKIQT